MSSSRRNTRSDDQCDEHPHHIRPAESNQHSQDQVQHLVLRSRRKEKSHHSSLSSSSSVSMRDFQVDRDSAFVPASTRGLEPGSGEVPMLSDDLAAISMSASSSAVRRASARPSVPASASASTSAFAPASARTAASASTGTRRAATTTATASTPARVPPSMSPKRATAAAVPTGMPATTLALVEAVRRAAASAFQSTRGHAAAPMVRGASRSQPHQHSRYPVDDEAEQEELEDMVDEDDEEDDEEEEVLEDDDEEDVLDEDEEEDEEDERDAPIEQHVKRRRHESSGNDPIPVATWRLPPFLPLWFSSEDGGHYEGSDDASDACNGDLNAHMPDRMEYALLSHLYNNYKPERDNLNDPNSRIMRRAAEALNNTYETKLFTPQSVFAPVSRLSKVFILYHKILNRRDLRYSESLTNRVWDELLGKGDPDGLGVYLRKDSDGLHVLPYPVIMEKLFNNPVVRERRAQMYRMRMQAGEDREVLIPYWYS